MQGRTQSLGLGAKPSHRGHAPAPRAEARPKAYEGARACLGTLTPRQATCSPFTSNVYMADALMGSRTQDYNLGMRNQHGQHGRQHGRLPPSPQRGTGAPPGPTPHAPNLQLNTDAQTFQPFHTSAHSTFVHGTDASPGPAPSPGPLHSLHLHVPQGRCGRRTEGLSNGQETTIFRLQPLLRAKMWRCSPSSEPRCGAC
jgi:hypothetical protein